MEDSTQAIDSSVFLCSDQLAYAREVLEIEGHALRMLARKLDSRFCDAANLIHRAAGSVIVTGMGKAGWIGRKISATLASTGTPAHFLHPAEAVHGDLGRIRGQDVLLALSQSGETAEVVRVLPTVAELGAPIIAMTGMPHSSLARAAAVVLDLGDWPEACAWGLAPTTSTTAMAALGDALALVVSAMKGFRPLDFARFHPAGALGLRLRRVEEQMRPLADCRVAEENRTVRDVFVAQGRPGRRPGALMLVNAEGRLSGIFTDSDLARLFEQRRDDCLDQPIANVMTRRPVACRVGMFLPEAVAMLAGRRISELPVLDDDGRPIGMIDITDLVGLVRAEASSEEPSRGLRSQGHQTVPFPRRRKARIREAS